MNSLSPAQIEALLYLKQDSPKNIYNNIEQSKSSSDDDSITMLSPPLSPYPTKAVISPILHKPIIRPLSRSEMIKSNSSLPVRPVKPTSSTLPSTPRIVSFLPKSPKKTSNPYKVAKHDPKNPLVSSAWSSLQNDPVGYFQRERAYLDLYPVNGPTWSNYVSVEPINIPSALLLRSSRSNRSRVSSRRRNDYSSDSDATATSMVTRSNTRNNPKYSDYSDSGVATPVSIPPTPKRVVSRGPSSRASTPSRVHELSLSQITDYSPGINTLPTGKSLKAEWKGAPMDLSDDPNIHLLHPAEVHLASVLRLPADLYIDSKKRLFAEKVHRMRQGLPFRRTDSQKACRIDVNKASRLFSAYERVGWLEDHHFKRFL